VAVFPDRIVLKNSTDSQAAIEAAIGPGGADAIAQGEIVLGIENTDVKFYTKAGNGSIVTLGGTGYGGESLANLNDVDLSTPPTDGQALVYSSASGNWVAGDIATSFAELTDTEFIDTTGVSIYQLDPLPGYTGGRVVFNPNSSSVYDYAGLSAYDNGNLSVVGGSSSSSRATISLTSGEQVYFHPDPTIDGTPPTDYTARIEVDGAAGRRILYRTSPVLGTGTSDLVVPTMGQVRAYADASGGDVEEAPLDGQQYGRQNGAWSVVSAGGLAYWGGGDFDTGISDGEPADGGNFD